MQLRQGKMRELEKVVNRRNLKQKVAQRQEKMKQTELDFIGFK